MSDLTPTQLQVLSLLTAGSSLSAAAAKAGVHRNTVANWRSSPAFRAALNQASYEKALYWHDQVEDLAALAIAKIREVLTKANFTSDLRLKAALAILEKSTAVPPPPPEMEKVHNFAQSCTTAPALPAPESAPDEVPQV